LHSDWFVEVPKGLPLSCLYYGERLWPIVTRCQRCQ